MKITLDLTWSIIDFEDTPQLFSTVDKELRYKMGFREDGYMFSPAYKGGHWDGYTTLHENYKLENKPFIKYPTGLTDEVDAILGELQTRINFEYTIFDNRPDPLLTPEDVPEQFHLKSAESGDITLRDYQMDGVRAIAKSQVGVLHLATNSGKCFDLDTNILTEHGYQTMRKIIEDRGLVPSSIEAEYPAGDLRVVNRYGELESASHITFNGVRKTKKITLDSGIEETVTLNHPLLIVDESGEFVWRDAKDLRTGDLLVTRLGDNVYGTDSTINAEEAYCLGAMIADSHLASRAQFDFTNDQPELLARVGAFFTEKTGKEVREYTRNTQRGSQIRVSDRSSLEKFHEKYGIGYVTSKDKEVPPAILNSPKNIQISFLSGYLECECSIDKNRGAIEVISASKKLLSQIQLMLKNMGVLSSLNEKVVKNYEQNYYGRLNIRTKYALKLLSMLELITQDRKDTVEYVFSKLEGRKTKPHKESIPNGWALMQEYRRTYENLSSKGRRQMDSPETSGISKGRVHKIMAMYPDGDRGVRSKLERLSDDKLFFDEIVAIADGGCIPTFDLSVPGTNSFVANSIVNHNTLTAAAIIKLCYDKLERGERIAFFTHSSAIFNQVHKELTEALGIRIGKYGNGKKVIDTVSVVMIPTVQAALKIDPEKGLKLSAKERIVKRIAKDLTPQFDKGINQRLLLKNYIQNFQPKTKTDKDYINEVEEVLYTCGTDAQVKFKLNSYVVAYNKIIEKKNKDLYTKRKDATEYLESLVAIISDEHHHVKSDSYYNVLMSCTNAIVRVGLTGSIDEKDKMLMKRMKGSTHGVVARVSNDYLIGEGFSAKPKIILTPVKQVLLNGHQADISGEKDYRVVYDNGIVHNQYRNTLIAKITEMCYQDGDGVLIIVNRIDHGNNIGEILSQLNVPFEFVTGDHDVDSREDSFQAMKDGHLKVLISTSLIDEGVSISGINSLIMAAGGKSMRQVLQRTGRVLRKKKGDNTAKLYDFRDQTNTYLLDHATARESIYIEEGFEIIRL